MNANVARSTSSFRNLEPAELMKSLVKDGTIFFDSVGNFPQTYNEPLSLIAHRPERILRGHISDVSELESVLLTHASDKVGQGYPDGGLAGWIDYEGNYTFGVYSAIWVYSHQKCQWIQEGKPFDYKDERAHEAPVLAQWEPSTSRNEFEESVLKAQDYIAQGHIYQVNLSQKFSAAVTKEGDFFELYESLRAASPAPMACYGNLGRRELLSSSPETFLRMSGNAIETRPIKGTSPRYEDRERDHLSAYELMTSQKENAELIMITDLLRNDLGMVCEYGSVSVDELLSVEKLEHVYHMVSTVKGTLRSEISQVNALKACLPGGSITGAPKIRATQIIEELENVKRGLYTGVVGYLGFNGESQFNIIIRSLVKEYSALSYHVGAGIVADSDPGKEYEETMVKAEGIRRALASV